MAQTLALLHGFTGGPASWDRVLAALPREPVSFRPWLLGHGSPPAGADVESFEEEVGRLATWLADRGSSFHLAGYSLGGRLALGLLARHPHLFTAATLIGTSPGLAGAAERRQRAELDEVRARTLESGGVETFVDIWQGLPLFASQAAMPAEILAEQRRQRLVHGIEGLARSLRILGPARMLDYRPDLETLDVPVTLLAGELDEKFCQLGRDLAERLPRGRFEKVNGAGHNLLLEAPEAVARALRGDPPR